ncbi:PX domain-containing protein [Sphaceloma murrayae]|uniref:PX domain-containing protein n=1 Tax=Sphaceloma murrayae TaxID=2082308 RepID=A0A2K1QU17_9PEZI|nr:PX domain-containing protein [Sphaceloma murrayae]
MNGTATKHEDDERAPKPGIQRFDTAPEWLDPDNSTPASNPTQHPQRLPLPRTDTQFSVMTHQSIPPPGSILTGKQEHYLKRELISQQTEWEISELSHPTALRRFGAPFSSDAGEIAPEDSELPLLRFIFVNNVRNFPFLDKAREKEFWQDKLQTFLESFANKHISSSDDRLEDTKRRKLATKAKKLVELMMVSGIPTASGYEERIRFSEMEVVDRGAQEQGLIANIPTGHEINGWDVNVAAVRTTTTKRHVRHHQHAQFLLRVKQTGKPEYYIGRRYGEFVRMQKKMRLELPGKVLPPLPRKNKSSSLYTSMRGDDDDADSISSQDTQNSTMTGTSGLRGYLPSFGGGGHKRSSSRASNSAPSPRGSIDVTRSPHMRPKSQDLTSLSSPNLQVPGTPPIGAGGSEQHTLFREEQRVSLRAFLRGYLSNPQLASTKAMREFLTADPIELNEEELEDVARREEMDHKRVEEQQRFYEIAQQRARELDVHMEKFRRDIVESNGLTKLFVEIKQKKTIQELAPEYQKFAEWLRIEVAATLYHLFLAEDNSPELFAQFKRIHSLVPYAALKQVIRFANPAAVMSGVLDLFLAQPFGAKSLLQRIFGLALGDGIRSAQRSLDGLTARIDEPILCEKIKNFVEAEPEVKEAIRIEAHEEQIDLVVALLKSDQLQPELEPEDVGRVFNAYVAWNNAVENVSIPSTPSSDTANSPQVDDHMRSLAELYARLKQLLKLQTRARDKVQMLHMIEEPTTLHLFRDLFTIFYEPLVRVYKSANVYNSVTDFARFADDAVVVIEQCQRQDVSADPNQTVQAFIDLCQRHEGDFYKFVHEVHVHDNGLFDQLMQWIEGILTFLRHGPKGGGKLDMNALFAGAVEMKQIDKDKAVREINALIRWQEKRKKWHADKTRQKMASGDAGEEGNGLGVTGAGVGLGSNFKASDFGLHALDLQDLEEDEDEWDSDEEEEEDGDPIVAERKRRAKRQEVLRRSAGEPKKPNVIEVGKMKDGFLSMLRMVLAE